MKFEEIASKIYAETDVGRGIATAAAGVAGLATYLWKHDWVISAFTAVIVFPVVRIISDSFRSGWIARAENRKKESRNIELIGKLSSDEKDILKLFVHAGGACVSWGYVNSSRLPFPRPALNSMIARGLVQTSVMEDGMTESFVLDVEVFDLAQKHLSQK